MVLSKIKKSVLENLDKGCAERNINTGNVRDRVNKAFDIMIEADNYENSGVDNGLQDIDEYNFNITEIDGSLCFVIGIGSIYSSINIIRGGLKFMKELFSLPDTIEIHVESRDKSQGYEFDNSSVMIISLIFKF